MRNENLVEEIVGGYFQYMLESHLKLSDAFAQYRNLCCTCILAMADLSQVKLHLAFVQPRAKLKRNYDIVIR